MMSSDGGHEPVPGGFRRYVTGVDPQGQSTLIASGAATASMAEAGLGGLYEIWADASATLAPTDPATDLGPDRVTLTPPPGGFKVRWVVIEPTPEGVPLAALRAGALAAFARMDGAEHLVHHASYPGMHATPSIDVNCVISGELILLLDDQEVRLRPGDVVVQRGTRHAWSAVGGPATFVSILMHAA